MDDYRYHIAIENHIERRHWTEKLADCFLAGCLPFYFGDPDYAKAFPEDSVIPIDIYDINAAETIIREAIASDQYSKRLPDIQEARRRVIEEYNVLSWVAKFIASNPSSQTPLKSGTAEICGRHAYRRRHPFKAVRDAYFRTKMRQHPLASPLQR